MEWAVGMDWGSGRAGEVLGVIFRAGPLAPIWRRLCMIHSASSIQQRFPDSPPFSTQPMLNLKTTWRHREVSSGDGGGGHLYCGAG